MIDNWKIHNFNKRLEGVLRNINTKQVINQELLIEFHNYLFAEGLSIPRVTKYIRIICQINLKLNKDFKKVDKIDIVNYLTWLETSEYAELTKKDFKITLKKFFRWLNNGEDPDFTKWFKCTVRNKKKIMPQEILTQKEVMDLMENTNNIRDKAFLSILYESGCRIGEILTLKLKHVTFDKYGVILVVNGKTGVRRVRLVTSTNLLGRWLNIHPSKTDTNNFLWTRMNSNNLITYNHLRQRIKKIAKKSNINKRVNPHSFRHARATHLANKLTEAQMKEYFGWTQGSNMASVYVHLSGRDVDNAILSIHGLKQDDETFEDMKPIMCGCGEINNPTNNYCNRCGKPLKLETAIEIDENKNKAKMIMNELVKNPQIAKLVEEIAVKL